jgi:hypothetical protein
LPIHRDVDPEVVAAELHHPRLGRGRLAEDRQVVQVLPEHRPLAALALALAALALGQLLVAVHDVEDLLVAAFAQDGGDHFHRLAPLPLGQVA